jgi:hypothetical protein
MKVLIQDRESQLFLGYNGWTDKPQEAKDLGFTVHAHSVANRMALRTFQILFYFPDIDYKVVVSDNQSRLKEEREA